MAVSPALTPIIVASISSNVRDVGDAVSSFFAQVGQLDPKWLGVSLVLFQAYLLLRSRALFNALREAYPDDEFQWRRVWGAYVTGFGLNNVLPAGTGNLVQYVFTRDAIPSATYAVVVVAIASAAVFDGVMSLVVLGLCFTTTRSFPHLAQIAGLSSFDIGLVPDPQRPHRYRGGGVDRTGAAADRVPRARRPRLARDTPRHADPAQRPLPHANGHLAVGELGRAGGLVLVHAARLSDRADIRARPRRARHIRPRPG